MKKKIYEGNRGFTLVEIMVALAIVLILGTIAIIAYFNFLNRAREAVCETNQKGLQKAVELYVIENEALPAILGDLEKKYLEKGFYLAMEEGGWRNRLAHSFLKINIPSDAYASMLTYENLKKYGASATLFHCPADHNEGP